MLANSLDSREIDPLSRSFRVDELTICVVPTLKENELELSIVVA